MQNSPDETLSMLADLTAATDPALRDLARKLAGRILIELAQSGKPRPRGIGKMSLRKYQPDAGDIDIDASLDALNELRVTGVVDADELRVRGWLRPGTAISLVVDRSGSMGGKPLANSAMAAASIAAREPADYSVLVFGKDVIAAKSQLARSRASRRITVLLSDCRATVDGDARAAAVSLEELVVIAPLDDDAEARVFADAVGARFTTVSGPSDIPDAMRRVLD
jgi:hypothetical protein